MTLSATPTLQAVNTELGRAAGFVFDMNTDVKTRYLAKVNPTPGVPWNMSSLANQQASVATFVIGDDPSSINYGFASGVYGSMTPNSFLGTTASTVHGAAAGELIINLNGNLPQNFWKYALFSTTVNSAPFAVADSATPFLYAPGGVTQWGWFGGVLIPGLNIPALNGQSIILTLIK